MALTGLTVAEYFRDEEGADTLLFIDKHFPFPHRRDLEVSALGWDACLPPWVISRTWRNGNGRTAAERITSTKRGSGITSVQAIYVPAD